MKQRFFILFFFTAIFGYLLCSCKHEAKSGDATATTAKDSTHHSKAIDDISELIKKDSLNPSLYFRRAQLQQGQGDLKSALSDMYLCTSIEPGNNDYNLYTADLFFQMNEVKRALGWMDRCAQVDTSNNKYNFYGGKYAYILQDYPGALTRLNEGLKHDIFYPDIYFYKGMVYKEMGDTVKALSAFQTCTEQDPKNSEAFLQIALLLRARKDKMADKYFDNAAKANPQKVDALRAKGIAQQESGKYKEALETFKQMVGVDYKNEDALYGMGVSYLNLDSVRQAYKYFDMAIKMSPTYEDAFFKKAICAEKQNNIAEAQSLYQQCLNLDPKDDRAEKALKRLSGN